MATFYNNATLSYNGAVTTSNTTVGEIVEALAATKTALVESYHTGDSVTYIISLTNSNTSAITDLTVTDTLGEYTFGTMTLVPLTYADTSLRYYSNGVLQTTPTITSTSPLTITGITVPASGNVQLIYEATANRYAAPTAGSTITNSATVSGDTLLSNLSATETITVQSAPQLTIAKSLSPTTITESGTVTYTFLLQNTGNTAVVATDTVSFSDTFSPALSGLTASFNGTAWTSGTNYTYDSSTGVFTTTSGQITIPAATYTQDAATGAWTATPGISTLIITGTI